MNLVKNIDPSGELQTTRPSHKSFYDMDEDYGRIVLKHLERPIHKDNALQNINTPYHMYMIQVKCFLLARRTDGQKYEF